MNVALVPAPHTEEENILLAGLIERLQWPLHPTVFHALCERVITVPFELLVFDGENRILLIYRDDGEYPDCYHTPGTVMRDTDEPVLALWRILESEIPNIHVTPPELIVPHHVGKGDKYGENPSRREVSMVHGCRVIGVPKLIEGQRFFRLDELPGNLLTHHHRMITKWALRFIR